MGGWGGGGGGGVQRYSWPEARQLANVLRGRHKCVPLVPASVLYVHQWAQYAPLPPTNATHQHTHTSTIPSISASFHVYRVGALIPFSFTGEFYTYVCTKDSIRRSIESEFTSNFPASSFVTWSFEEHFSHVEHVESRVLSFNSTVICNGYSNSHSKKYFLRPWINWIT